MVQVLICWTVQSWSTSSHMSLSRGSHVSRLESSLLDVSMFSNASTGTVSLESSSVLSGRFIIACCKISMTYTTSKVVLYLVKKYTLFCMGKIHAITTSAHVLKKTWVTPYNPQNSSFYTNFIIFWQQTSIVKHIPQNR